MMFDAGVYQVPQGNVQTQVCFGAGQVIISSPSELLQNCAILGLTHCPPGHSIGDDVSTNEENTHFDVVLAFSNKESIEFLITRLQKQLSLFEGEVTCLNRC